MDTIKNRYKRTAWSLPFLVSVIIMTLVIAFGTGRILFVIDGLVIDRSVGY